MKDMVLCKVTKNEDLIYKVKKIWSDVRGHCREREPNHSEECVLEIVGNDTTERKPVGRMTWLKKEPVKILDKASTESETFDRQDHWPMPVIPATQKAEIGKIAIWRQPRQKVGEIPSQPIKHANPAMREA
jgi:hypothetical protein